MPFKKYTTTIEFSSRILKRSLFSNLLVRSNLWLMHIIFVLVAWNLLLFVIGLFFFTHSMIGLIFLVKIFFLFLFANCAFLVSMSNRIDEGWQKALICRKRSFWRRKPSTHFFLNKNPVYKNHEAQISEILNFL